MGTRRPLGWILRHKDDGRFLCVDNRRRDMVAGIERIKVYKREHAALRRAGYQFVCHAIHEGESIDICGRIHGEEGVR